MKKSTWLLGLILELYSKVVYDQGMKGGVS